MQSAKLLQDLRFLRRDRRGSPTRKGPQHPAEFPVAAQRFVCPVFQLDKSGAVLSKVCVEVRQLCFVLFQRLLAIALGVQDAFLDGIFLSAFLGLYTLQSVAMA